METRDEFWMVWNETGSPPKYKHKTYGAAETEAKRIARLAPGSTVIILKAVAGFKMCDLQQIEFAGVPF
jgi:hypothetical protein